eukprot:scaffold2717_cov67-Phaeocystis_antarctica.AAC.3
MDDPPRSLGVEHDAPGHLRLDGHVAVDAERRTALLTGAHVVGKLVGARHQHDPAHRAIALWRRGRVGRTDVGPVDARPVPIEVTGRGRARRVVVQDPLGCPTAGTAVWVPVEPVGRAVRFVVRRPGGRGALHGVVECCCAA